MLGIVLPKSFQPIFDVLQSTFNDPGIFFGSAMSENELLSSKAAMQTPCGLRDTMFFTHVLFIWIFHLSGMVDRV